MPLSVACFVIATTGAELVARTTIEGEALAFALRERSHSARLPLVGTFILLAPFAAVAFVCTGVEKRARSRSAALNFGAAMLALIYFYFQGHQAAQHAAIEQHWTAAASSIGFPPFFIGLSVVMVAIITGILVIRFDRRWSATGAKAAGHAQP